MLATEKSKYHLMSVVCMIFMIRIYLTAKCSQSLSIRRSMMLRSIKLPVKSLESLKFSVVCSEHEVLKEDKLPIQPPIVVQSVQFEGLHSGVSKECSSESL